MGSPLWHCNEVHLELARPALPLPLFLSGFKKKVPGNQAVLWGPKDAGVWVGQPFCRVICSCLFGVTVQQLVYSRVLG